MQHNMKTKCEIKKGVRVNNMYDIYIIFVMLILLIITNDSFVD